MDIRKEVAKMSVPQFIDYVRGIYRYAIEDFTDNGGPDTEDEHMECVAFHALYFPLEGMLFGDEQKCLFGEDDS